jgi:hypothetical protein
LGGGSKDACYLNTRQNPFFYPSQNNWTVPPRGLFSFLKGHGKVGKGLRLYHLSHTLNINHKKSHF